MLYDDRLVRLPLPPEPGVGLLVQLQTPSQAKPDQDGTALLQVQAVSGRGRMDEGHRNLSRIPVGEILRLLQLPGFHPLLDTVFIMLEPIGHQDRFPVGAFHQVF